MSQPQNQTQQSEQHPGGWGAMLDQVIRQTESMAPEAHATLLDKVIAQCPDGRGRGLNLSLEKQIAKLEELLPAHLKGQAARFIKIAMLTFSKPGKEKDKLRACSPASFLRCVFEAAQFGFAIDGRLFHAVPYGDQAQCQPDYKGLIAVAKRSGAIKECESDNVYANDEFSLVRENDGTHFRHAPKLKGDRGAYMGSYCRLWLPHEPFWVVDYMSADEVGSVAKTSKAFKSGFGPWVDHPGEMRKKTVAKRALKTRVDDPMFSQLLELDDREYEPDPNANIPSGAPVKPDTNSPLDQLAAILPPAPGEQLASFSEGTEPAPETTEAAPAAAGEPDEDRDGLTLDALDCELSSASESWEVDDTAARFAKSFHTPAGQARAAQMIETKRQSMPRSVHDKKKVAPPAGKQKQKNLMDTHSNTGK